MANSNTIFISAYRNFSIRYILYSDILKELRLKYDRIVIFVKDNDIGYYRKKLEDEKVLVEPVHFNDALQLLKKNALSNFFVVIRKCISGNDQNIENTTDRVRIYQYGQQMSANLMSTLKFLAIRTFALIGNRSRRFRKMLVEAESFIFNGKLYDHYFRKYQPDKLIISSIGYMIDPYFMRAAKRANCKVISIIHSWDNPTTKDYRGATPDHVITWNEIMKNEVRIFHDIEDAKIHIGGIAHWDFYFNGTFMPRSKKDFLEAYGLSPRRKTLFYATSNFRLFERTFDVIEEILVSIEKQTIVQPAQLLVRLHPGYLLKDGQHKSQIIGRYQHKIEQLKARFGDLLCFTTPMMKFLNDDIDMPKEDMHMLAECLHHSDLLLTEYSTVMIEAAIFNLPIINVGLHNFRDTDKPASYLENYTHIKRILRHGASKNAYTYVELMQYINAYFKDPSLERDNRKKLIDAEITTNRGTSGKFIGKLISELS